jgi:hypothetical protein
MNDKIQDESTAYFHYFDEFERVREKAPTTKFIIQEDENGELYIELPQDLLEKMGWDYTTDLIWTVNDDGTIALRKKTDDPSNEA